MDITINIRSKIIMEAFKGQIKRTDKVLDLGCGNGLMAKKMHEYFGCKIFGTDIMNYLEWKMPFRQMKGSRLPFSDKEFDVVMINDVLHHCETCLQLPLVMEALRVGKNVLVFETKPNLIAKVIDIVLNKIHNPEMPLPLTHRTPIAWSEIFESKKINYKLMLLKRPFYYPLIHYAFSLSSGIRNT